MTTIEPAGLFEAAELVRTGKVSAVDLTEACLARIAEANDDLRAFIMVTADLARADAARAHKEIAAGKYRGALHGIRCWTA